MKKKYIMIYPWKFVDSLHSIYCLDKFSNQTEVVVLDMSSVVHKKFSNSIAAPSSLKNIKKVTSIRQMIYELDMIRKYSRDGGKVCVNYLVPVRSLATLLMSFVCFYFLKGSGVKVLVTLNHGMPVFRGGKDEGSLPPRKKRLSTWKLLKRAHEYLWTKVPSPMDSLVTHKLIAGKYNETKVSSDGIEIIKGHCHNYDSYLSEISQKSFAEGVVRSTIVFLDAPGPLYRGDYILTGDKVHKTIDLWYPSLCAFFDKLEKLYGATVVIAAHYKSNIKDLSDVFGGREVFSECTNKLVLESKLVITEQSSAVAFAAIYKKPVFFVYSDELRADSAVMEFSDNMSVILKQLKLNINQLGTVPSDIPTVDEGVYQEYVNQWLTSNPIGMTNEQLIENAVFK